MGDVIRAPYFDGDNGPRGAGSVLIGYDIPGINKPNATTNFQLYDKVLMSPPAGSVAAERESFVAYTLGEYVEDSGMVVIPTALLQVVRAPRDGDAAIVEVLRAVQRSSTRASSSSRSTRQAPARTRRPSRLPAGMGQTAKVRYIHRDKTVLPSLNYYVLFDLTVKDGLKHRRRDRDLPPAPARTRTTSGRRCRRSRSRPGRSCA